MIVPWASIIRFRLPLRRQVVPVQEKRIVNDPVLDILKQYPANLWKLNFSETRLRSQWAVRASGSCINPKGAMVTFEIYAPPLDAIYECGFVKVTVDTILVYRRDWDGYILAPERNVRDEVLKSPYWKWIESRYEANLQFIEVERRNELAEDAARSSQLFGAAMDKL